MHFSCKPIFSPNMFVVRSDENAYLIDSGIPNCICVSKSGAEIVNMCQESNIYGVINRIKEKYGLTAEECRGNVQEYLEELYRARAIYYSKNEYFKLVRERDKERKKQFLNISKHVNVKVATILLTNKCNLQCRHCYLAANNHSTSELSYSDIIRCIDQLSTRGIHILNFSGGEPLMHKDWRELCSYSINKGFEVSIASNGTLITDEVASFIRDNGINVQISIDGACSTTNDKIRGDGSFRSTMSGIEKLISLGHNDKLMLSVTPMKENIDELKELIDLAIKNRLKQISFTRFNNNGRASSERDRPIYRDMINFYTELLLLKNNHKDQINIRGDLTSSLDVLSDDTAVSNCPLGQSLVIDSSGYVFPCAQFVDKKYALGNIRTTLLSKILSNNKKYAQLRKISFTRKNKIEKCNNCICKHYCKGGCMAEAYAEYGTLNASDPLCEIRCQMIINELTKTA